MPHLKQLCPVALMCHRAQLFQVHHLPLHVSGVFLESRCGDTGADSISDHR